MLSPEWAEKAGGLFCAKRLGAGVCVRTLCVYVCDYSLWFKNSSPRNWPFCCVWKRNERCGEKEIFVWLLRPEKQTEAAEYSNKIGSYAFDKLFKKKSGTTDGVRCYFRWTNLTYFPSHSLRRGIYWKLKFWQNLNRCVCCVKLRERLLAIWYDQRELRLQSSKTGGWQINAERGMIASVHEENLVRLVHFLFCNIQTFNGGK